MDIIAKIKKLYALAGSPNPHEAALARSKAEAIMEKYGITKDDLHGNKIKARTPPKQKRQRRTDEYYDSYVRESIYKYKTDSKGFDSVIDDFLRRV